MASEILETSDELDVESSLAEFEELDRRRLFGEPALEISEVEHWLDLRSRLEFQLGDCSDANGEPQLPGRDRREFIRVPTHIRIHFRKNSKLETQVASDVSQGGMFIAIRRPLKVGSEVRLQIERKGSSFELPGTVVRARESGTAEQPAGMGIRFGELVAEQRRALAKLLQDLALDG